MGVILQLKTVILVVCFTTYAVSYLNNHFQGLVWNSWIGFLESCIYYSLYLLLPSNFDILFAIHWTSSICGTSVDVDGSLLNETQCKVDLNKETPPTST